MRNRKSNLLVLEHRLGQLERRIKNEDFDDMDDVDDIISGEVYALVITSTMTDVDYYFIGASRSTIMKYSDEIIEKFLGDGNGLDRLCRINGIRQFDSEYNRDRVMKAWEFCDTYGCDDDDIFIDDDQLVYISDTRNGTAWVVDTVKHIHEDF